MATYKEIRGTNIEVLASDPSNPVEGQVWFNSTSNVLKGLGATTAGTWATGGTMNTARNSLGGAGTQTAALGFGGQPPNTGATESYNGTNWTEVNDMSARNGMGSTGTQTSAIAFAGEAPAVGGVSNFTELWNGTNWTEVNNLNTARMKGVANGTSTDAIAASGNPSPAGALTETWNGVSWVETSDLSTPRREGGASGNSTAAVAFTGELFPGSLTAVTEEWNVPSNTVKVLTD